MTEPTDIAAITHHLYRYVNHPLSDPPGATASSNHLSDLCNVVMRRWKEFDSPVKVYGIKVYCIGPCDALVPADGADQTFVRLRAGQSTSNDNDPISQWIIQSDTDFLKKLSISEAPPIHQLFSFLNFGIDRICFSLHSATTKPQHKHDLLSLLVSIPLAKASIGKPRGKAQGERLLSDNEAFGCVLNRIDYTFGPQHARWAALQKIHPIKETYFVLDVENTQVHLNALPTELHRLISEGLLKTTIRVFDQHDKNPGVTNLSCLVVTALLSPPRSSPSAIAMIYSEVALTSQAVEFFAGVLPRFSHIADAIAERERRELGEVPRSSQIVEADSDRRAIENRQRSDVKKSIAPKKKNDFGEPKEQLARRAEKLVRQLGFFPRFQTNLASLLNCPTSSLSNAIKINDYLEKARDLTTKLYPPTRRSGISLSKSHFENIGATIERDPISVDDVNDLTKKMTKTAIIEELVPFLDQKQSQMLRDSAEELSIEALAGQLLRRRRTKEFPDV